jgi:hypothetical protein
VQVPELDGSAASVAPTAVGAIFPMIPLLSMQPAGASAIEFWEHARVSDRYKALLATYYDEMQVDVTAGTGEQPAGPQGLPGAPTATGPTAGEPLAEAVFSDYFALLAKGAVHAARALYDAYPYKAGGSESLAEIVAAFDGDQLEHRAGRRESLATIAASYGCSVGELRRRNPSLTAVHHRDELPEGTSLSVPAGPSVATVAEANAGYPLWPFGELPLAGVKHQVAVGGSGASGGSSSESIYEVAARYSPYGLGGPTGLFGSDDAGTANAENAALLTPGRP